MRSIEEPNSELTWEKLLCWVRNNALLQGAWWIWKIATVGLLAYFHHLLSFSDTSLRSNLIWDRGFLRALIYGNCGRLKLSLQDAVIPSGVPWLASSVRGGCVSNDLYVARSVRMTRLYYCFDHVNKAYDFPIFPLEGFERRLGIQMDWIPRVHNMSNWDRLWYRALVLMPFYWALADPGAVDSDSQSRSNDLTSFESRWLLSFQLKKFLQWNHRKYSNAKSAPQIGTRSRSLKLVRTRVFKLIVQFGIWILWRDFCNSGIGRQASLDRRVMCVGNNVHCIYPR